MPVHLISLSFPSLGKNEQEKKKFLAKRALKKNVQIELKCRR